MQVWYSSAVASGVVSSISIKTGTGERCSAPGGFGCGSTDYIRTQADAELEICDIAGNCCKTGTLVKPGNVLGGTSTFTNSTVLATCATVCILNNCEDRWTNKILKTLKIPITNLRLQSIVSFPILTLIISIPRVIFWMSQKKSNWSWAMYYMVVLFDFGHVCWQPIWYSI